jgi:hypothetical protein
LSDTLNSFDGKVETGEPDVDTEALLESLDSLSFQDKLDAAEELGISVSDEIIDTGVSGMLDDLIREHLGVPIVKDVTHAEIARPASTPPPTMVNESLPDDGAEIVSRGWVWWQNPYTGNRVANNCRDVDGRADIEGRAVLRNFMQDGLLN